MDLNTILIIVGIIALIALIGHGVWSNYREKSKFFNSENSFTKTKGRPTQTQFSQPAHHQEQPTASFQQPVKEPQRYATQAENQYSAPVQQELNTEQRVEDIKISIPGQNSKPATSGQYVQREMEYAPQAAINPLQQATNFAEPVRPVVNQETKELRETAAAQVSNVHSSPEIKQVAAATQASEPEPKPVSKAKPKTTGYIMLYVVAPENSEFNGLNLAKCFDDLGFVFGQKDIYHRHLDLSGANSPVIFSIANIQQPGTFDYYHMAEFSTVGITLFMQLPSVGGKDLMNLKLMIQNAKTLANDLGGFILTDEQELFDAQAEQDYLARVA